MRRAGRSCRCLSLVRLIQLPGLNVQHHLQQLQHVSRAHKPTKEVDDCRFAQGGSSTEVRQQQVCQVTKQGRYLRLAIFAASCLLRAVQSRHLHQRQAHSSGATAPGVDNNSPNAPPFARNEL